MFASFLTKTIPTHARRKRFVRCDVGSAICVCVVGESKGRAFGFLDFVRKCFIVHEENHSPWENMELRGSYIFSEIFRMKIFLQCLVEKVVSISLGCLSSWMRFIITVLFGLMELVRLCVRSNVVV